MDVNIDQSPLGPVCPVSAPCEPTSSVRPADSDLLKDEVHSFFITNSLPASPPKGWSFLPSSEEVRSLKSPLFALCHDLQQRFGQRQLVEAGIITDEPFANLSIPIFNGQSDKFVVDRDQAGCPRAIYNECGTLLEAVAPAIFFGRARVEGESKDGTTPLLVVDTIADLQVLRGLGFLAILSVGLPTLNATRVEELFASHSNEDQSWRYWLVIADWNIAEINAGPRPRATAILKRLVKMQMLYSHDPKRRFGRWRPGAKAREDIRDAFSFQDAKRIQQLIKSSLPERASGTSSPFYREHAQLTYSEARSKIYSLLTQSSEIPPVAEIKKAVDQFRQLYHREVLSPMYAAAERSKSPSDRAVIILDAELHEEWFEKQKVVRAAEKVLAGIHPGLGWELDADDFNERLRLNNLLLKIRRDLLSTGR